MLHPSVLAVRVGLAALRAAQPGLPGAAGDGLRRGASMRLRRDERPAERAIEALRGRLRHTADAVEVVDYGAGSAGSNAPERRVAEVYRRAATGPAWGRFLFGLVRGMGARRVLELGTNLGVGAAHLAAGLALNEADGRGDGRLVTLEGAPALAVLAAGHLARLGHGVGEDAGCRVRVVVGPFADTLGAAALEEGPFDLVFVDGHHEAEAALAYVEALGPHLADGALVVLDDVEPGRDVRRAWDALRAAAPDAPAVYAGKYGLVVHTDAAPLGAAAGRARGGLRGTATPDVRETAPPPPPAGPA